MEDTRVLPDSFAKLADELLNIKDDSNVLDFLARDEAFSIASSERHPNATHSVIAKSKADADAIHIEGVEIANLENPAGLINLPKFDRVFYYPTDNTNDFALPGTDKDDSSDERMVVLMNHKFINKPNEFKAWREQWQKEMLDKRLIEAVIALPQNVMGPGIEPMIMIVISHNNDKIRMIDATKMCTPSRRMPVMTDDHIKEVASYINNKSETAWSKYVPIEDIIDNSFFNPLPYLLRKQGESVSRFDDLIVDVKHDIKRGVSPTRITPSNDGTGYKYIKLGDIKNDLLNDNLEYVKPIDDKSSHIIENSVLEEGNILILSKMGMPIKVAVVNVGKGEKFLVNFNMYAIKLNGSINPYYVQAYLESERGQAMLQSINAGDRIMSISKEQLAGIEIPRLANEEEIAEDYKKTLELIKKINQKLDKIRRQFN